MSERMNPEVKAKWLAALRSGEYPQTVGTLHRIVADGGRKAVGWCCYGVLCDLAHAQGVVLSRKSDDQREFFEGSSSTLPYSVYHWAGLPDSNPMVCGLSLAQWNDHAWSSFSEIADLIEEYL